MHPRIDLTGFNALTRPIPMRAAIISIRSVLPRQPSFGGQQPFTSQGVAMPFGGQGNMHQPDMLQAMFQMFIQNLMQTQRAQDCHLTFSPQLGQPSIADRRTSTPGGTQTISDRCTPLVGVLSDVGGHLQRATTLTPLPRIQGESIITLTSTRLPSSSSQEWWQKKRKEKRRRQIKRAMPTQR